MPPKTSKKDDKKDKAKPSASGAKQKKKKWSKSKTKDKVQNLVVFDKPTYDKLLKEIPSSKLITPAVVSERLKINGSLARRALRDLVTKGLIKPVVEHNRQLIYTRTSAAADKVEEAPKKEEGGKKQQKGKKAAPVAQDNE
eukprot:TRINITY_DN12727_c0_g1_i2.p1 TRINITY_DN12727_c0_g1~~TRINITY_DN12727_c0_g1_i2.p1  ORF type:complete len:141 (-),score=51.84 TRINITY_DN12727_c0_g1_i2:114-536(-)